MEDKEIVKALEDWIKNYDGSYVNFKTLGNILDLINRQKADYDRLQKAYLRNQEIFAEQSLENERLKAEIERLKAPTNDWLVKGISKEQLQEEKIQAFTEEINRLQAENERLKPFEDKIAKFNSHIRVEDMLVFASSLEEWLEFCENLKAEAYKECIGKVKDELRNIAKIEWQDNYYYLVGTAFFDNLIKEIIGE